MINPIDFQLKNVEFMRTLSKTWVFSLSYWVFSLSFEFFSPWVFFKMSNFKAWFKGRLYFVIIQRHLDTKEAPMFLFCALFYSSSKIGAMNSIWVIGVFFVYVLVWHPLGKEVTRQPWHNILYVFLGKIWSNYFKIKFNKNSLTHWPVS